VVAGLQPQTYVKPEAADTVFELAMMSGVSLRQFPLRLDYGRSPQGYVNRRLQIQLELLMMSGVPVETGPAFNERGNYKTIKKLYLVSYFS
jgi:hypothetical protein